MTMVRESEFARQHSVTRNTVMKWKRRGWLVLQGDRVDVEASNARLKRYRRDGLAPGAKVTAEVTGKVTRKRGESPTQAADRIALAAAPFDLDEALRVKESYLALLNKLDYDRKSAAVVAMADVAKVRDEVLAPVRKRLLAIPREAARLIVRTKTVVEVQDVLQRVVTRALEELSGG